jgi:L,D-transpeptidase ErfK/SrfK
MPCLLISILCLLGLGSNALALTLPLPADGGDVVGQNQVIYSQSGQSLSDIAMEYGVGFYELIEANPQVNSQNISANTPINIPGQFILPSGPRTGLVINLAELRVYYYLPNSMEVMTFPIAIGKEGWGTPLAKGIVTARIKDPVWVVPVSIREESARQGTILPEAVMPGPKNPLGHYALRLSIPSVLLHGTTAPRTIGRRGSHGCMRMYPTDIETLYNTVTVGTPVLIVNEPVKVGIGAGKLYAEAHVPLQEYPNQAIDLSATTQAILTQKGILATPEIDWSAVQTTLAEMNGLPQEIGNITSYMNFTAIPLAND